MLLKFDLIQRLNNAVQHEIARCAPFIDLIFAISSRMVRYFKAATTTIPIVGLFANPVEFGLVAELARPGGNITGLTAGVGFEILTKRLEMLREAIPSLTKLGYVASREVCDGPGGIPMQQAAQQLGISLIGPPLEVLQETEYRRVFAAMKEERAHAIMQEDTAAINGRGVAIDYIRELRG